MHIPPLHLQLHLIPTLALALLALLSTKTLATPTAPPPLTPALSKRVDFPGCIADVGSLDQGPCTCACDSGYKITPDKPYTQDGQVMCDAPNGNFYGPVGCASCVEKNYGGALICEGYSGCTYAEAYDGTPEGCYCWECSTECATLINNDPPQQVRCASG